MSRAPIHTQVRGVLVVLAGLVLPAAVRAEGTDELGAQELRQETVMFVDIIDPSTEIIVFDGDGKINVTDPSGSSLGSFASGATITPTSGLDGAYALQTTTDQTGRWNVRVIKGSTAQSGRLHSYAWSFNAGTYGEGNSFTGSLYFLVSTGSGVQNGVVEMKAEGLTGWEWRVLANGTGVTDADGRSVSTILHRFEPTYPAYLNPPEVANYLDGEPFTADLSVQFPDTDCDGFVAGLADGEFVFTSGTDSYYHITCDLDGDGRFDFSSDGDLNLSGNATSGVNRVTWNGYDNEDHPVEPGTYTCQVMTTLGEIHYVAEDIETAFPGIRLFNYDESGARSQLRMYWNDSAVQAGAVTMPNGEGSRESSGATGIGSGPYGDDFDPNANARAWGDFTEFSKGNVAYLDTWTWLLEHAGGSVEITVIDGDVDDCWDDSVDSGGQDSGPAEEGGGYFRGGCAASPSGPGSAGLVLAFLGLLAAGRREH